MIHPAIILFAHGHQNSSQTVSLGGLEISLWIAIVSLLFASGTYWYDKFERNKQKKKRINQTKENLIKELRFLYNCVLVDILRYKAVKDSNYRNDFNISVYNFPVLNYIIQNNEFHIYFKNGEYSVGLHLHMILRQMENYPTGGFSPPIRRTIDWCFEDRLKEIREGLLQLVVTGNLISNLQADDEKHRAVTLFLTSLENE